MGEYDQRIKQRREDALKALNVARAIKTELGGVAEWPADKQDAFDAAMADFKKFHEEASRLETRQTALAEIDQHHAAYTEPGPTIPHRGPDDPRETQEAAAAKAHRDSFHRYIYQGDQGLTREEHMRYVVKPRE